MPVTDPVADMLTRIRNALVAKKDVVEMPASKMKASIARILQSEGYIRGYEFIDDGVQGVLKVRLKYTHDGTKVISGLKKISKPGLRIYVRKDNVPKVLGGLGVAIISTSRGVITDSQAREQAVGGEVIAYVW